MVPARMQRSTTDSPLLFPRFAQLSKAASMGMKVVYSAPNRAHHYDYARELHEAGILKAFVSGFPRYSPRSPIPEIGPALKRVDRVQTLYVASLKFKLPTGLSEELAHWSKIRIDKAARRSLRDADIFLFYNGCGLDSARWFRRNGGIGIVEAVNTHVLVQEQILAEEHRRLGLPWRPFHSREVKRRVAEVEEADCVLLPSTFVARSFLAKGFPADRILRVPYPMATIPGVAGGEPAKGKDGVFRILYVGTVSVRKGLRYLIEAFHRFKYPKKELWIVGPIARPSGLEGVSLPENTTFFGPLKGNALQDAYRAATIFCLPSVEDGFGLVLNEALHYDLPVIATENTGMADLLLDGKGGMVVPIRDSSAILEWLHRLASDYDFLEKKRMEAGQAKARLLDQARTRPGLPGTLIERFCRHDPAQANKSD
jgi:starch synthase